MSIFQTQSKRIATTNLDLRRNPALLKGLVIVEYTKMESMYLLESVGSGLPASFPWAES